MENVFDTAQFIISAYRERTGCDIDEMKLHKLLYFSQREHIAITGNPMFEADFEGWRYGPVCRSVRTLFSNGTLMCETSPISARSAYIVRNMIEQYGSFDSWRLSEITHNEISWKNSRVGIPDGDPGNRVILLDDIREDAKKVRPYDSVWDMYYDEFEDAEAAAT